MLSPFSQPALPDHPPVSPFLDPRSPLISRSPKELYPSPHHVSGMNSAPFFTSAIINPNHKTSSSARSSVCHPRASHSKLKSHLFKLSFSDSPDSISAHSSPKLHPP